jgi:hypothetical protein
MKKNMLTFFSILVIVLLSVSCSPTSGTATSSKTLTPLTVLTPSSDSAIIGGVLLEKSTGKPPVEGTLYLAEIAIMTNGKPVAQIDRKNDPYAFTAPNGEFVFQDVKPGKYGLVYYTPELNFLLDDPKGSGSLIIDVAAGQVIDVGTIELILQ